MFAPFDERNNAVTRYDTTKAHLVPRQVEVMSDTDDTTKRGGKLLEVVAKMKRWEDYSEDEWREEFFREGVIGPFPSPLEDKERDLEALRALGTEVVAELDGPHKNEHLWKKIAFLEKPLLVSLAMHPIFVQRLKSLLRIDNIGVVASMFAFRGKNISHRLHTDSHTFLCPLSATIWIGLTHTNVDTALLVISRSHINPESPERNLPVLATLGLDPILMDRAVARDPEARMVKHDMGNGDFLIFHGQVLPLNLPPPSLSLFLSLSPLSLSCSPSLSLSPVSLFSLTPSLPLTHASTTGMAWINKSHGGGETGFSVSL